MTGITKKLPAILGIKHITTSYSNPEGNADNERIMREFKEEVIYQNEFESFEEAKNEVDRFITFYNHEYPHSALWYLSPVEYRIKMTEEFNPKVA